MILDIGQAIEPQWMVPRTEWRAKPVSQKGLQWFPTHIHQGSPLILSHFNEMDLSI